MPGLSARRRRALAAIAALAAILPAGCGEGEEGTIPDPPDPPAQENPTGEPPGEGEVAVVDLRGETGVEPERIDFASDASMVGLSWEGWGSERARGTGSISLAVCDPNCARGGTEASPAVIELSAPVDCDGARYYSEAEVTPQRSDLTPPAAYIEPPC